MHQIIRRATGRAAIALSCLIVVQVCGAASGVSTARSKTNPLAAVQPIQRDTGPALNGSTSSHGGQSAIGEVLAAAEAARQDQDPSVNGSVGDLLLPQSDASLHAAATAARRDTDPGLNGSVIDGLAPGAASSGRSILDMAWDSYERCHWREAFNTFATLADPGDLEAGRMALSMVLYGPVLYQQTFDVSIERLSSWRPLDEALATANGPLGGTVETQTRR